MTDDAIINAVLQTTAPVIEELVNAAVQGGRALGEIAVVLQRQPTGEARASCTDRGDLVRALHADARLTPNICLHIEEALKAAKANQLPVVIVMEEKGGIVAGIQLVTAGAVGSA